MTSKELKETVVESILARPGYSRRVGDTEIRTRCPFCGDSQKNLNTGHLYIRINIDDNLPMLYNCFKCGEHGVVNQRFLDLLEVENTMDISTELRKFNKYSDNFSASKFINGVTTLIFDYKLPLFERGKKTEYVEKRLGRHIPDEGLRKMKVITSLKEFLILNGIKESTLTDLRWLNAIEDHYVGFLTYGNSYILFRDITGKEQLSWLKYPITVKSKETRAFYTIESTLDIFTKDKITINLAEGVMDIASAFTNLEYDGDNILNIAICGRQYTSTLEWLISMGLIGDNIDINIFADNDKTYNMKNKSPTDLKYFNTLFNRYKYLFRSVTIYYNGAYKDIGVPLNQIALEKYRL